MGRLVQVFLGFGPVDSMGTCRHVAISRMRLVHISTRGDAGNIMGLCGRRGLPCLRYNL